MNQESERKKNMKENSKEKVSVDRCLIPEACKFVSMCVKLSIIQSLNMCLLGACYETHTILEVMKLTPGASIALDIILSQAWISLFGVRFWHKKR